MPNRRQSPNAPNSAPGALFRTDTTSPTDRRRFYPSVAPHPSNTAATNTNTTTISLVQQNGGGRTSSSSSSSSRRNSMMSEIDIKEENIEGDNGIKMSDRNTDDRDRNDENDDNNDDDDDDDNDDFVMANDQNDPPKKAAAAAEEKATQTEKETEKEKEREKETVANTNTNNNNNTNHSPVFELVTVNTASFGKSVIKCTICSNRRRACARLTADHGAVHWLTYHADGSEYLKTVDELQKLIMERLGEQ